MNSRKRDSRPYSLKQFKKDGYSLAVFKYGRLFFHSREKNLRPLTRFIVNYGWRHAGIVVYDKYIGRAAALLLVRLRPAHVYTPLISEAALPVFRAARVGYTATRRVPHLMGIASKGTCEWEKLSFGRNGTTLWRLVKKRILG